MAADVGSAIGYLDLDISGFLSGLRSAQSEADATSKNIATKIGNNMQSAGKKMTAAGKKMTATGTSLTKGVTVPVFALGGAIVKTSADFESSMSKVAAISGATGEDFDALSAKAREMGSKTKFSASESAEAFQYMAMAGWDVDSMLGGISGVMNLAAASGEELGTVSDIVTDAMTAFGLSAKGTSTVLKDGLNVEVDNTTRFVDALAAASNSSNTNVAMLGESFKYVAPVAGALGYSVEDVAVALGLMANQGIKSSQSGTALRTMLTNMANPTDTMASAMNALGVSLENDDGSMKSLMEVMTDLRKGFGGGKMDADEFKKSITEMDTAFQNGEMSQEDYEAAINDLCVAMYGAEGAQKAQIAAQLAGKTGMAGLLAIVNSTDEDFQSLTESIYNASGTSQEMADIMQDNVSGQLTILKSMLEELALQFGEVLLPVMRKFVEWLQGIVTKLQELSPEQREQIVKWAAIAAAVGPVLIVLGKLVTSVGGIISTFGKIPGAFKDVGTAFSTLKTGVINVGEGFKLAKAGFTSLGAQASPLGAALGGITAPIAAIIAIIAVLVAAFATLWKTNEDFRNKMIGIWEGIKSKFEEFTSGIVERLNALGFNFESITDVLWSIWSGFCDLLAPVFEGVFSVISSVLGTVMDVLTGILDVFIGIFTGNWDQCWAGIKEIFGGIWDGIVGIFTAVINTLKGIFDTVLSWFGTTWSECWTGIQTFFTNIWNSIVTFFTNIINGIVAAVSNFVTSIITFFAELPTNIALFITNAWNAVVLWATNMVNKAREMGTNFLNGVVSSMTQLPGKIQQFLTSAINNLATWVTNMGTKGKEAITSLINNVVAAAKYIPSKVMSIGSDIVSGVWKGICNAKDAFVNNVKGFFSGIVDGVKDALGIGSPSKVFAKEVGKWMPAGVAVGFEDEMPATMSTIEDSLNKGIDGLETDDVPVGGITTLSDTIKSLYNDVATYFESIEQRLNASVYNMAEMLSSLIRSGQMIVNSDGTLGYVGYNGFTRSDGPTPKGGGTNPRDYGDGDTFVFNSPKAIDEVEAARQMKKTKQEMAEGF